MNALLKRIEKLEEATRPPPVVEPLRIIRLVVAPNEGVTAALCGGRQIERREGEQDVDFRLRAAKTFNRAYAGPCVEAVDGDEDI